MNCIECSNPLSNTDVFCGSCGHVVDSSTVPAGDSSPRLSKLRLGKLVGGLTLVMVLGVGAAAAFTPLGLLFQTQNPLYEYVPDDATFMIAVDLLEMGKVIEDERLTHLRDELDDLARDAGVDLDVEDLRDEILRDIADGADLTGEDHLAPWIGRWVTVWLRSESKDLARVEDDSFCLLAQVRDTDAADESLDEMMEELDDAGIDVDSLRVGDLDAREFDIDDYSFALARDANVVVLCSSESELDDSLEAAESGRNLENESSFSDLRDETSGRPFVESFTNLADSQVDDFDFEDSGFPLAHFFAAELTSVGIEITHAAVDPDGLIPSPGTNSESFLPASTFLAINTNDLGEIVDGTGLDRSDLDRDLDDWLETLEGGAALALTDEGAYVGNESIDLGLMALSTISGDSESSRLVDRMASEADDRDDLSVGDIDVAVLTFPDLEISVGVSSERFYFASSLEDIERSVDDPLAGTAPFEASVDLLPAGSEWFFYLNTSQGNAAIMDALEASGEIHASEVDFVDDLFDIFEGYVPGAIGGLKRNRDVVVTTFIVEFVDGSER